MNHDHVLPPFAAESLSDQAETRAELLRVWARALVKHARHENAPRLLAEISPPTGYTQEEAYRAIEDALTIAALDDVPQVYVPSLADSFRAFLWWLHEAVGKYAVRFVSWRCCGIYPGAILVGLLIAWGFSSCLIALGDWAFPRRPGYLP